jgi:hypothetical protein
MDTSTKLNSVSDVFFEAMKADRQDRIMEGLVAEEALLADGFEDALVGHTQGPNLVAVYDYDICIQILMDRDEMSCMDAVEFMDFNVLGAYVGEKTPVFVSCR